MADKYFSPVVKKSSRSRKLSFKSVQKGPQLKIKTKKTDQAHVILGFLTEGRNYKNKYIQTLLAGILGAGASSRLFNEVRQKRGLAYAVNGSMERYSDTGYFGIYLGTGIDRVYEAIKVVLDQCMGVSEKNLQISEEEFTKVKGYLKGHFALGLERSEIANDFFSEQVLFDDRVLTPEEVFGRLDKVTIDEIYAEARKLFLPKNLNLAIIGPYKDEEKFKQLL